MENNRVRIAKILREHGVKGECKIQPLFGCAGSLRRGLKCHVENERGRELDGKIISQRETEKIFIVKLDFFSSPEEVAAWRGAVLSIDKDLRKRPESGFLFDDEWMGMTIVNEAGVLIGEVKNVVYLPLRQWVVQRPGGGEVLIPVVAEWILKLETSLRRVTINSPDGLLEL